MPAFVLGFLLVVLCVGATPAAAEPDTVDLMPSERAAWSPRNIFVGLSSALGRWNYWYADRYVLIETVPADASIGLYYIRSNFQKRYELAQAPVRIRIPPRVDTTHKDAVTLHVMANGYLAKDVSYHARQVPEALVITLAALPNSLVFFGHTDLAGRTTLTLRTTEEPELRISKSSRFSGFTLALTKTANKLAHAPSAAGGHVAGVELAQVAEDVLIRVETTDSEIEVRSKNSFDPIREEHIFALDLMKEGARAPSDAEIRADLHAVRLADGCLTGAAQVLREKLDPQLVARTFRPSGALADLYRREAMKELGSSERGTVRTFGDETLQTGSPIELELALQSATKVRGYLELLVAYSEAQSDPATALRSLLAPELGPDEFAPIWRAVEAARKRCGP